MCVTSVRPLVDYRHFLRLLSSLGSFFWHSLKGIGIGCQTTKLASVAAWPSLEVCSHWKIQLFKNNIALFQACDFFQIRFILRQKTDKKPRYHTVFNFFSADIIMRTCWCSSLGGRGYSSTFKNWHFGWLLKLLLQVALLMSQSPKISRPLHVSFLCC